MSEEYSKYAIIPDAIIKILLLDSLPCYDCSETAMKSRFCSDLHLFFYSCFELGSKHFPGSFASDIYFSRATGNEAELTKFIEAIKTFAKYFWILQTKYT